MLFESRTRRPGSWEDHPAHDRTMLALQYMTAIVAVAAAGFLSFIH
jgi:hypothetical protein